MNLSIEKGLKTCPLCRGWLFAKGKVGGYFCPTCQPIDEGRVLRYVVAESRRGGRWICKR